MAAEILDWPELSVTGPQSLAEEWVEDRFAHRIHSAAGCLAEAASGNAAFHLSHGLADLQAAVDAPDGVLESSVRGELLQALAAAHAQARLELPGLDRGTLHRGVEGASAQVMFLGTEIAARASWSDEDVRSHAAAARVLRNALHNVCLLGEIEMVWAQFDAGELNDEFFARRLRAAYKRIAENDIARGILERELASRPPRTRPPLRLVG